MTNGLETWENVTAGDAWVLGTNHRGAEMAIRIKGGKRVQVKTEDREAIELSKPGKNPFQNGRLRRVDPDAEPHQTSVAITDEELRQIATGDDNYFLREWLTVESELNVRRLAAMVKREKIGSYANSTMIEEIVRERFPFMTYTPEQISVLSSNRRD